jgi:hypothetical protein
MKSIVYSLVLSLFIFVYPAICTAQKNRAIVVNRPTIVAFFPPVTAQELSKEPDTNEALSDFQEYATRVRGQLQAIGVDFEEIYASSFAVKRAGKTITFHPKKAEVGYYFVEPGKAPRVEYGVMSDEDMNDWLAAHTIRSLLEVPSFSGYPQTG